MSKFEKNFYVGFCLGSIFVLTAVIILAKPEPLVQVSLSSLTFLWFVVMIILRKL